MADLIIDVQGLEKTFDVMRRAGRLRRRRELVEAVAGIDLAIERGAMVGYIGPNGAGKSTTIKMLTGILVPSAGHVRVDGLEPSRERTALAGLWRDKRGATQRLGERDPGVLVDADHLARGLHPRADRWIDAPQLGGRERRRLDRHERRRGQQAAAPAQLLERGTQRDPHRELDHRHAGHLGQERDGA